MANSTTRRHFDTHTEVHALPNLIRNQIHSYEWFIEEGLKELFAAVSPIEDFTGKNLALYFRDFHFEEPKFDELTAKAKNATYEVPLKAEVELVNKETGEVKTQEIFLGDYPWMTERGTFVINGVERVVVSQLVRSPGVFFTAENTGEGLLFGAKVIPDRGAWLEFDTAANGVISVKIDRKRKLPVTTLLRSFGYAEDKDIEKLFKDVDTGDLKFIKETLDKDATSTMSEALMEVYRRIRPGDLATVENSKSLIEGMFFDPKRYDFSKVGRYKLNKRLNLDVPNKYENRIFRREDLVAIIAEIIRLNNDPEAQPEDIDNLANRRLRMVGELIQQKFRVGLLRMERNVKDRMSVYDRETVTPGQLINVRPVVASVKEFFASSQMSQFMDQTNPLAEIAHKRRITAMGAGGLSRERAGFEVRDVHRSHYGRLCPIETPEGPNIGLVSNLSTYAQVNEYGFIETPYRIVINKVKPTEATGHIARTTIKDDKGTVIVKPGDKITDATAKKLAKLNLDTVPVKAKVTTKVVYLDAADEADKVITEAATPVGEDGYFKHVRVPVRRGGEAEEEDSGNVEFMDVSSRQIVSVSAALIPFIEHDDPKRALMGSNMQKQAVALVKPQAPVVGTGIEGIVARDSAQVVVAEANGVIESATASQITVKYDKETKTYPLLNFVRSNDGASIHQRTIVESGQKVKKGDILADGMSTENGELALGQNILVAFMSWSGYNFEDAIILSRRLVQDDRYSSIHIETHQVDVRDTKLGAEVVTRDIPNVSEDSLKDLDEGGIVRIGAEVSAGDILVGKITPKGEQELSSEEKLLRAIFGEKARDVKDTSLRMPNGERGKVVGVKIFSRDGGDELPAGVIEQYYVSVAQMRKISVGDKMAGRHGNKGVIARIVPVEDMPHMADGTPVDMILNPLGVGARMNLGQVFETHLGWAAQTLGYTVASPVFQGVTIEQIKGELKKAGLPEDGKAQLFDGRTGDAFQEKTTVGYKYMLKLNHMVDDKIHARSTGPYAMVTQQPLGGKAQRGGQRFGEMEVWALEAYGAANTLQEILTIKSDDVVGRSKAYEAIIKGEEIRGPRIPESFNVLVKELQSLTLGVELVREESTGEEEVDAEEVLTETTYADVDDLGTDKLIEGDVAVADMPLVDLAGGTEDQLQAEAEAAEETKEALVNTEEV